MRYYLNVTDVATAIGRNPYKDPQTIVDRLLNKPLPKEQEHVQTLLATHKQDIQQLAKEKDVSLQNASLVAEKQALLLQSLTPQLTIESTALLAEQLKAAICQESGKQQEECILNRVEQDRKTRLQSRNTCMKYKTLSIGSTDSLKIGGRPDAIEYDTGRIVEVKRRQKKLFTEIPKYEQVQIQLYMWLFDAKECLFTQSYFNESETTLVSYDAEFVETVKKELVEFVQNKL